MSRDSDVEFGAVVEDYLSRLECHETPDRDSILREHPRIKQELMDFFANLDLFDEQWALEKSRNETVGLGKWFPANDPNSEEESYASFPKIPGYKILDELGSGSQGDVYKAEQLGTQRTVALKIIREGALASRSERLRFESEVQLAARLNHPNVVSIFECGRHSGCDFFAMEYVEGVPIDEYVRTSKLDIRSTVELFVHVVEGVSYAHQRGVIHRDLKPNNVIVDREGIPHILDFGLAKAIDLEGERITLPMTQRGAFAGTWFYASPEQIQRDSTLLDVRSDVYALGVTLFELLTDEYPYQVENETRSVIAQRICETPPTKPSSLVAGIEDDLETIVLHTLAKEPNRRYQSADQLLSELHRYLKGEAIEAKRDSAGYMLRKALRRYRWSLAGAGVFMLAFLAFLIVLSVLYSRLVLSNATTFAKMSIVRSSQRYVVMKLMSLQRQESLIDAVRSQFPDVAQQIGALRNVEPNLISQLQAIFADFPQIDTSASEFDFITPSDSLFAWLDSHEVALKDFARNLEMGRIMFSTVPIGTTKTVLSERHESSTLAHSAAVAFSAAAFRAFRQSKDEEAIFLMEALRNLATDMSEGILLSDKAHAIDFRSLSYGLCFKIFEETLDIPERTTLYLEWLQSDPPLPPIRPALVAERFKWVQVCEELSKSDPVTKEPILDWTYLREFAHDLLPKSDELYEHSTHDPQVSTFALIDLIDKYMSEVEKWDDLTIAELSERRQSIGAELRTFQAWSQLQMLFPSYAFRFERRCQVASQRLAALYAGELCRFFQNNARWPEKLESLPLTRDRQQAIDPINGVSFGYRTDERGILLYSFNYDEQDDNGQHGVWGARGTDYVFFTSCPKARN